MNDRLLLLHLATGVVGFSATVMIWPMTRGAAEHRWMVWPLLLLTAATTTLLPLLIWAGGWTYSVAAIGLVAVVALHWDSHLAARRRRPAQPVTCRPPGRVT
jgi:hypothetical protein